MKKSIIIVSSIVVAIIAILFVGYLLFSDHGKICDLLYEKYGEKFRIIHDGGAEYKSGLFPTNEKTGYKNVQVAPINKGDMVFNVRLKTNPLEIYSDEYVTANILYNTARKIEDKYKLGNKMYVYMYSEYLYNIEGNITDTLFDNKKGSGMLSISIYVEGYNTDYEEYINKLLMDLNFNSNSHGIIRLYFVEENEVEEIKNYYKKGRTVYIESSDSKFKSKYSSNNKSF